MEQKKFESMMMLIVPKIIKLIVENNSIDEVDASIKFYKSQVYKILEHEETKLWHLSPLTLYNMYEEEVKTGKVVFPEEA